MRAARRPGRAPAAQRRPRVLLLVENVPLARDHRLHKQVEALHAAGADVSVICPADPANRDVANVHLYEYSPPAEAHSRLGYVREYGLSWMRAGARLVQGFARERFDALQIAGNPDIYFPFALPFRWSGRPVVFDQRDLAPEVYQARYGTTHGAALRLLLRLERASYRTADHVLVVNRSLREIARRRGNLLPQQVTIVGNGPVLAQAWRRPQRPELKRGRRYLAVWVGLMGPQDSVEVALLAIQRLVHVDRRTDCQFAFVGDGEARPHLQRLAGELAVQDWVDFPGWADQELAFTYLSTADIGVEPNLEEVVSPVKVQEYMAFQLPVVAFDLAETRGLAEAAGVYAPAGDVEAFAAAIRDLLDDPVRRRAMGAAGRSLVDQHLCWDQQREAYLDVWRNWLPLQARRPAGVVAETVGAR